MTVEEGVAVDDPGLADCADCQGLGAAFMSCQCRRDDQRTSDFIRRVGNLFGIGRSDGPCLQCNGDGAISHRCYRCQGFGRVRAQLVYVLINLDLGTIASTVIEPGAFTPVRIPTGGWCIDSEVIVDELAARLGVAHVEAADGLSKLQAILLPKEWRPDLDDYERLKLEATTIARASGLGRWKILFGRMEEPAPLDADSTLTQLCRLASALCLDLVIDKRRFRHPRGNPGGFHWDVRFETSGTPVAAPRKIGGSSSLAEALAKADPLKLLENLPRYDRTAPAYRLAPAEPPADLDLRIAAIEDELNTTGDSPVGAIATWCDSRWHYSSLRSVAEIDGTEFIERIQSPPRPAYWAEPVFSRECHACADGPEYRYCHCAIDGNKADAGCVSCAGTGIKESRTGCFTCGKVGEIRAGAVVTITDLDQHHTFIDLSPDADAEITDAGLTPGNATIWQLPDRYRLSHWLSTLGIPTDQVIDPTGAAMGVDNHLERGSVYDFHGTITTALDATSAYLADITKGRTGARIIIVDSTPAWRPLESLAAIATGLQMTLEVVVRCYHHCEGDIGAIHGDLWGVHLRAIDAAPDKLNHGHHISLRAAVNASFTSLGQQLSRTARDTNPTVGLPAPQQPHPPVTDLTGLEQVMHTLAERYTPPTGTTIACRLSPGRVSIHHQPSHSSRGPMTILAEGRDLSEIVPLLGL
ncbi:hypothetical protein [Phytomonospora endophytica]|uniref:Uncharacterized protein n=1 Tax=Phytomonospora endophytica TaxID=714109 RepID=A0A841FVC2_9ACTN|nr:hypothetical protein [Phytomonospora endophytica]MBB6037678.1 hypothetical protein [Phytomonospora endophytica]GIG67796.1 hypothetical protein Pen01_40910 [Phytomonospora endophytica]